MNTSDLVLLTLEKTPQQTGPQSDHRSGTRYGTLEDAFQDRVCLDDIELGTVQHLGGRLEQPRLEQLDRGRDAKQQGELDPALPGTNNIVIGFLASRLIQYRGRGSSYWNKAIRSVNKPLSKASLSSNATMTRRESFVFRKVCKPSRS